MFFYKAKAFPGISGGIVVNRKNGYLKAIGHHQCATGDNSQGLLFAFRPTICK
jgi:hypothetical protein